MAWSIEVSERARKDLAKLGAVEAQRIVRFLRTRIAAADDPRSLGKPLRGSHFEGVWRYRVGNHRILVEIQDSRMIIMVLATGHRSDVYR